MIETIIGVAIGVVIGHFASEGLDWFRWSRAAKKARKTGMKSLDEFETWLNDTLVNAANISDDAENNSVTFSNDEISNAETTTDREEVTADASS